MEHGRCEVHQLRPVEALTTQVLLGIIVDYHSLLGVVGIVGADVILKATKVDGVYEADPAENPEAKRYETISFHDALTQRLGVLDSTAFSLCMDNDKPLVVFDMMEPGNISRALTGDPIGTLVGQPTKYADA